MSDNQFKTGATRDPGVERAAVAIFGARMLEKLQMNSDKAHWGNVPAFHLLERLKEEVCELEEAMLLMKSGDEIISEACDVALFAMFIADNLRKDSE